MGTLNIGLPTSDVGTDGALIYTLFGGFPYHPSCNETYEILDCLAGIPEEELEYEFHPTWTTMLFVPFLLNYISSWFTWYRIDKRKKITWLACLFNVYPQLRAASVIRELWRDPKKGVAKKKKFERDGTEAEVFLESVMTTFVMTYILTIDSRNPDSNSRAQTHLGTYNGLALFTYFTSIISAGLGMAKSLKVGPCRILPDKGLLGGLLTGRFLLIFLSCTISLLSKAFFLMRSQNCSTSDNRLSSTILVFLSVTVPGLITGIIFIRHRSLLKTFLIHPSLLLLPAFTFFSFESNKKCCKSNNRDEVEITFSVKATSLNILFSIATTIVFIFTGKNYDSSSVCEEDLSPYVPLPVSIFLTAILLLTTLSSPCSCSCSSPTSISSSCCPPLEFGIYLPDSPHKVFVKDQTQPNGRREIEDMGEVDEEAEEEEMNMDEEGEGNERGRERKEV